MKLGFTIHSITTGPERTNLPVNSVQSFDDAEYDRLLALGAVREPSEGEVTIYRALSPDTVAQVQEKFSSRKASSKKGAVESASEPDTTTAVVQAVDPDEVESI